MQVWMQIQYLEEVHSLHIHAAIVKIQDHTKICIISQYKDFTIKPLEL